jgi:hypothetical protein
VKRLSEYIPVAPTGSWEQVRGLIQRAAQRSNSFGGPANDDPKADDADTVRSYDIQVWGSFPTENRVVIYNDKTGGAWSANFTIDHGNVTFSGVKSVTINAESLRYRRIAARGART